MAISTNQKPTIYRNLYENTSPVCWSWDAVDYLVYNMFAMMHTADTQQ